MQVLKDNFKVLAPESSKMGFQCVTLQKASDNFVTGLIFRYCLAVIPFDYCPVDSTLFWYIISGIFWDFFLFAAYPCLLYTSMDNNILVLEHVSKVFPGVKALDDVSLSLIHICTI